MIHLLRQPPSGRAFSSSLPPQRSGPADRQPGGPEVVLDLSRLLSRVLHASPTGIDRVEMAYARTLQRLIPHRLLFAAVHPSGLYGRLPGTEVARFLDATEARWEAAGGREPRPVTYSVAVRQCWSLRPRPVALARGPRVVLQASPHHLDRASLVATKLGREGARFICLVHDLIPVSHPEYARPQGNALHMKRLRTIGTHADGLLLNSRATLDTLVRWLGPQILERPARVAHLGVDRYPACTRDGDASGPGYFVCIATIEPRKNHLMLLNLWRSLVEALGTDRTPRLFLVGRRGWENENVLDMLDRCAALKGVVCELPRLPDEDLRPLLARARALLMPSFAEGFGLPIVEALAAGIPVLASDLPAHREAGGAVPEYFDPIDGAAWRSAILDYAAPASARRKAQLGRLAAWSPTSWDSHIEAALALVEEVAACQRR